MDFSIGMQVFGEIKSWCENAQFSACILHRWRAICLETLLSQLRIHIGIWLTVDVFYLYSGVYVSSECTQRYEYIRVSVFLLYMCARPPVHVYARCFATRARVFVVCMCTCLAWNRWWFGWMSSDFLISGEIYALPIHCIYAYGVRLCILPPSAITRVAFGRGRRPTELLFCV